MRSHLLLRARPATASSLPCSPSRSASSRQVHRRMPARRSRQREAICAGGGVQSAPARHRRTCSGSAQEEQRGGAVRGASGTPVVRAVDVVAGAAGHAVEALAGTWGPRGRLARCLSSRRDSGVAGMTARQRMWVVGAGVRVRKPIRGTNTLYVHVCRTQKDTVDTINAPLPARKPAALHAVAC